MISILVSCANGSGTSLMAKMTAEKVCKNNNIKISNIHHCSLSEGKNQASRYDVVICPLPFIDMFKDAIKKGKIVIGLKNVMSQDELTARFKEVGIIEE